jgi:hypothetical protein
MLAILIAITTTYAIVAWRNTHLGIWILAALLPSYLLRAEIIGVPTTLLEMLVVTLIVVWITKNIRRVQSECSLKKSLSQTFRPLSIEFAFPILFLLISAIAVFASPDKIAALGIWKAYFLEPIILFFIVKNEIKKDPVLSDKIFEALGFCAIFLSIVAIVQWFTGKGIPIPWDFERRVTSVFDYPNALGLFLGPIIIIALIKDLFPNSRSCLLRGPLGRSTATGEARDHLNVGFTYISAARSPTRGNLIELGNRPIIAAKNLKKKSLQKSFFWASTLILSAVSIVLAQSEAAIVAVIITTILVGLLNRKTKLTTITIAAILSLLIAISPWRGPVLNKLTLQDYSGQVRITQWSETLKMQQDHWLFGAGLSGYPIVFAPYHKASHIEIFQYPHNIFLNFWVELGIAGLIVFLVFSFLVSRVSLFSPSLSTTSQLSYFTLLEIFIHGLVDVPYFKNDLAILTWMLLAMFFTYAQTDKTTSK